MNEQAGSYERYQRQIILTDFGEEGQRKLQQASVLVVGAGGLGCPALQYLAAAGVGTIGVVDDDVVSLHNLHRQILFTSGDVGRPKTETAAERLQLMNPEVNIQTHPVRLTNQNALDILAPYDLVLDGTDNFATRYLINDACVLLHKTLVYGAISQFEGQMAVFNLPLDEQAVNYRDLFPQPPQPGSVLNCAEAGVLGVLPGLIGILQATEVIKLITGMGKPLVNQLLTYNALTSESFVFDLAAKKETSALIPKSATEFRQTDYQWLCEKPSAVKEINTAEFDHLLQQGDTLVIDVREEGEQPAVTEFQHRKIPLSVLTLQVPPMEANTIVVFCQSGKRSRQAATILSASFGEAKNIYSLQGGIIHWKAHGKKA